MQGLIQQDFYFGAVKLEILLPGSESMLRRFNAGSDPAPYWAKLWPSAIALTEFLTKHQDLVRGQQVLELAAGLGLPSLYASAIASAVQCTDYDPEAVAFIQKNIVHNGCQRIEASCLDWKEVPPDLQADVLLLSDINYDPEEFDILHTLIERFLLKGTTILLATPQRLVAKKFVTPLLPWCVLNEERCITGNEGETMVNVLLLKHSKANYESN